MKNFLLFFISVVIYRVLLDINYIFSISPVFSYDRLECNITYHSMISSWVMLSILSILYSSFLKMKGFFIPNLMIMFFVVRVVPITSFIGCNEQPKDFVFWELIYWIVLFIFIRYLKIPPLPKVPKSKQIINIIAIIMIVTVVIISGYYTHFRITLDLLNVYGIRREFNSYNVPTIIVYIWSAAGNILPLLLIYYFVKGKKGMVAFLIFIIILNFSINGLKSNLFKMILCVVMFVFVKKNIIKLYGYLMSALIGLALIFDYILKETSLLTTMIVRRFFYVPALLDTMYYDYFKTHQPLYFMQKENTLPIVYEIGDVYFDKPTMSANNGMFSDAVTNMGVIGCLVMPFIIALFLQLFAKAFDRVNHQITLFVALLIMNVFHSTNLTTCLLTHGIILTCITLYLMSAELKYIPVKS